ncbi:MAG TPA: hypothetical protein VG826_10685 [Pirellulales bacterium]|nr:hypothetical protein [Pirellulales bacterium]
MGDGPAAEALLPRPRNLTAASFTDRALSETLWTGKPGSSMPPWNELAASDLRALVSFVHSLGPAAPLTKNSRLNIAKRPQNSTGSIVPSVMVQPVPETARRRATDAGPHEFFGRATI